MFSFTHFTWCLMLCFIFLIPHFCVNLLCLISGTVTKCILLRNKYLLLFPYSKILLSETIKCPYHLKNNKIKQNSKRKTIIKNLSMYLSYFWTIKQTKPHLSGVILPRFPLIYSTKMAASLTWTRYVATRRRSKSSSKTRKSTLCSTKPNVLLLAQVRYHIK